MTLYLYQSLKCDFIPYLMNYGISESHILMATRNFKIKYILYLLGTNKKCQSLSCIQETECTRIQCIVYALTWRRGKTEYGKYKILNVP